MSNNDDSRELTDGETVETLTLGEVIAQFKERNVGLVHGDRYTWVHGHSATRGGHGGALLVVVLDCYGDEIPGGCGKADVPVRVVVPAPVVDNASQRVAALLGKNSDLYEPAHQIALNEGATALSEWVRGLLYETPELWPSTLSEIESVRESFTREDFDAIDWAAVRTQLIEE